MQYKSGCLTFVVNWIDNIEVSSFLMLPDNDNPLSATLDFTLKEDYSSMLGAFFLGSFTFHITGETVIANNRNKYFQSKSFPSADGDFCLDFGDYMRDDGVKITDKQFVANQFNQTGFSKMGLDSSGRLTLRGVDLETVCECNSFD